MRLAYKDMAIEKKKHEEKIKYMDPKKQEQAERLGMGYASTRYVNLRFHLYNINNILFSVYLYMLYSLYICYTLCISIYVILSVYMLYSLYIYVILYVYICYTLCIYVILSVYMLYSLYICYTLCIYVILSVYMLYVILSVYRGMSHSAMSDMQVITQETPDAPSTRSANSDRFFTASSTRDLDDWEFVGGTSST